MPDDVYTHGHDDSVLRSHRARTVDNSAPHLAAHLHEGLHVLDVGCGPGTITVDLARRVAPGEVVGVDRSETVLTEARATAERAGVEVAFQVGDVHRLDFADDTFDIVHAHQVLQHLTDPVAALREMRRVCRPGGLVAVRDADYRAFAWAPTDERLSRWLGLYRTVAKTNGAEPDAGRFLKQWVLDAGFATDSVVASASVWCFTTDEERAWWGGLWADRMHRSDVASQALERRLTTPEELATISAGWREWIEAPDGWFAVLQGEIVATA